MNKLFSLLQGIFRTVFVLVLVLIAWSINGLQNLFQDDEADNEPLVKHNIAHAEVGGGGGGT